MFEIRSNTEYKKILEKTQMESDSSKKSNDPKNQTIYGNFELDNSAEKKLNRGCFLGQRHVVTLFAFLTCFFSCVSRLVLGVGIVAMVKHGQTNESLNLNETEISCPLPSFPSKSPVVKNFQGEFDWSPELQGYVLGSSYLSILITLIPAGRYADAVGSKPLLVFSNAASGILTLLSPFAARWNVYALIAVQFLRGGTQGFSTPAVYKLMSNWIPKNERGTLSTLVVCGFSAGIALGGIMTGWLCDIPGLGWPSAFYICGILTLVLAVAMQFKCYEDPANHPTITVKELKYITDGLETSISEKRPPTPWKKIFSSVPCYAYTYGLFGHYWSITYFATVHPTFMGAVLHYPMTENGVTSCLPVFMKTVGGVTASVMCHWITKKNLIGIPKLRKITTAFGAFGFSLCMVGILLAKCDAVINILCFTLSLFATGIALSGIMISSVDMAPTFAGSVMGITSTIGCTACVLIPVVTGWVTTHETLAEWQTVFWINLVVVGTSGLVYIVFGSAEVQPWNYPENEQSAEGTTEENRHTHKNLYETNGFKENL